jgi:signal transduction histidine kinase
VGIASMRERVKDLGGTLEFHSSPNGVCVVAEFGFRGAAEDPVKFGVAVGFW